MNGIFRVRMIEERLSGRRLGRHVAHDVRSLAFPAFMAGRIVSITHERHAPIFDQGELGSCTGQALAGMLCTEPFQMTLHREDAEGIYAEATRVDDVHGTYPPEDTGSSTLAVLRVAKRRGWIRSYRHAFGLEQCLRALVLRPGIVGFSWRSGCDHPDSNGVVKYEGPSRGGHEVLLRGIDAERELVWLDNSWGDSWGKRGSFAMTWSDFGVALADWGDAGFGMIA